MKLHSCFLSIIVPVYNMQKYLPECLDSLLAQDLLADEYEIICINDGSTDLSAEILNEYGRKHSNIRVIHKENGGVSSARNVGIENAFGDYLWFVDSDDFVAPNCLGKLKALADQYHPQMIRFNYQSVTENQIYLQTTFEKMDGNADVYSAGGAEICAYYCWSSLINKELIFENHIRFEQEMKYCEDVTFYMQAVISLSKEFVVFPKNIYYYRQVATSAIHKIDPVSLAKKVEDFLNKIHVFNELKEQATDSVQKFLIQHNLETARILLALLPKTQLSISPILSQLKKEGVFPLPIDWNRIRSQKSMRSKIILLRNSMMFKSKLLYLSYLCWKRSRTSKNN